MHRRLEVSRGGKWFLGFTILLGVVAINSNNNVIYLLESLLLSGLIFSGILSEQTISRVSFERKIRQCVAGKETGDTIVLHNSGRLPLFCVEVGEWSEASGFVPIAFLLRIGGLKSVSLQAKQVLPKRGRHRWARMAIATSFPFGFARKIKLFGHEGGRIVWPQEILATSEIAKAGELELLEGELEELDPWGDVTQVHWLSSARLGRPVGRPWRPSKQNSEIHIEDGDLESSEREKKISEVASHFYQGNAAVLVISSHGEKTVSSGKNQALDALALLPGGDS